MEKIPKPRTEVFRWNTRFELYAYFKEKHGLEKAEIDQEINKAIKSFKPRKGRAIYTKELWQKVGLNLEKSLGLQSEWEKEPEKPDIER